MPKKHKKTDRDNNESEKRTAHRQFLEVKGIIIEFLKDVSMGLPIPTEHHAKNADALVARLAEKRYIFEKVPEGEA